VNPLREAVRRHPRWVDAGLATLLALATLPVTVQRVTGVVGWVLFGVLPIALVWRRRAPVVVYWTVFGLGWSAELAGIDLPASLVIVFAALYAVARYRPRRYLWPAVTALEATFLLAAWQSWGELVLLTAVLAAVALLGMNVSTRRAYLAELEERARRLERERDQQAQLAAAAERARIAREMHDVVAHNLAVMVSLADAAALTAQTAPHGAADKMQKVAATGREALGEMRRLLGVLEPKALAEADSDELHRRGQSGLDPQPGLDDIDRLVDQVRATGLRVTLTRQGVPGRCGPGAGLTAYRIVQEALTNTIKHAGPAATAQVRLSCTPSGVDIEVTDDGSRRPAAPSTPGRGLAGMRERAASYGGRVDAGPLPDAGWRVSAHLSFEKATVA
jgi:signal transduction histidine kinase